MPYSDYYTDSVIIDLLCRYRVQLAGRRHERQLARRLTGHGEANGAPEELDLLLPPRQVWDQFRPQTRDRIHDVDFLTLRNATIALRNSSSQPWVSNLNAIIGRVQARALGISSFVFDRPTVRWMEKGNNKYRAITEFNLEDSIICSLTARYITDFVDGVLEDSSFAFRARQVGGGTRTYHSAFDQIFQIRSAAVGKPLWVAECDIQGFFDCVNHQVAVSSLDRVLQLLRASGGDAFAPEAGHILRAFLASYNYPTTILRNALPSLREARGNQACFGWPEESLRRYYADPHSEAIGVPQGGALSGLIANLVLDMADKRIKQRQHQHPGIHYFRYCDDMVLIAPDRRTCEEVFGEYLSTLDELNLPYHPPVRVTQYGKEFWNSKSKAPYCWAPKTKSSNVPWVQFVGHQIRYDGLVRVKPASVRKQKDALVETVGQASYLLQQETLRQAAASENPPRIAVTRSAAETLVVRKLICKGVGRVDPFALNDGPMPMCWTAGFKAIHNKPFVPSFLKQLDRERERQIRRFKRKQFDYQAPNPYHRNFMFEPWGYCYSYFAQFHNNGGMDLINNPYASLPWFSKLQLAIKRWIGRFKAKLKKMMGQR